MAEKKQNEAKLLIESVQSLNEEQQRFINEKKFSATLTAEKWMKFYKKLILLDEQVNTTLEEISKKEKWHFAATMISFGLGCIIVLPWLAAIVFLFYWLHYRRWKKRLQKIDVDDRLKSFVAPVTALMQQEMSPDTKIPLSLNMSVSNCAKEYEVDKQIVKDRGYPKLTVYFYKKPVLDGTFALIDDVVVDVSMYNYVRAKDITKKSRSGKIKYKSKYQYKTMVSIVMKFPKSSYNLAVNSKPVQPIYFKKYGTSKAIIKYSDSADYHKFKLRACFIDRSMSSVPFEITPADFVGLISCAYKQVQPY